MSDAAGPEAGGVNPSFAATRQSAKSLLSGPENIVVERYHFVRTEFFIESA
jgi:hypothetical protein